MLERERLKLAIIDVEPCNLKFGDVLAIPDRHEQAGEGSGTELQADLLRADLTLSAVLQRYVWELVC